MQKSYDFCYDLRVANTSLAAPIVSAMSCSVWHAETKFASNWLHGKYTPRSSIPWKYAAKRCVSLFAADG